MTTWFYLKSATNAGGHGSGPASGTSSRLSRLSRRDATEEIALDFNQDSKEVVSDILRNVSKNEGITKGRRLAYLNVFVKYLQHIYTKASTGDVNKLGYTVEEICLCLRTCLVHEATVIRMATLRVLRYLIQDEEDVTAVNATGIPYLIVRSLDVVLNNSGERMQAARFCQKLLSIPNGAQNFPSAVMRALISIAFDGLIEHDKLHRGSLSILCQLAVLNPMDFIKNGGVRVLLHNVLGCTSPMVLEAILGSLLHLLNVPETRDAAGVNLHSLVAPLTDLHFKLSGHEPADKTLDERELGYRCAKVAIGTVLRSWSGIAHFCQNENSGLQALIDALYIEQLEIRRTILDLICEIIGLKFPTWTDEVKVALSAVDPSYPKDSWKLQDGFVVQEALTVLPHLAVHTPNITANHKALLVLCFARRGLLDALVEVIVTSDTFISVRATVLLGELLSLVDQYLPVECFDPSQCIPSLIRHATTDSPPIPLPSSSSRSSSTFSSSATIQLKQHRAMEAVSVLGSLHKIKSRPPSPYSVFLQMQLQFAGFSPKHQHKFVDRLGQVQLSRVLKKEIEGSPSKILKETGVVTSKDPLSWNWDLICTLIRWVPTSLKRVDDSSWRTFLRRLIDFYKPTSNFFARMELGKGQSTLFARVGCYLVEFLVEEAENFSGITLLEELLADIAFHLDELLRHTQNPYVCFLSPNRLETTVAQTYFLFLGTLSHSPKGFKMLDRQEILKRLMELVREMQHDCYVKLIVSSLYYGEEYCRRILSAAMISTVDGARLYTTQFLRVLVRAKLPDFSKWGMELLVNQLTDKNRAISLTALDILEEAIHDKMFLESLIALRPTLTHLGDRGLLLLICFLSLPSGYKFLMEANFLRSEIEKWQRNFNKRYVELVEVLVRDSVSTLRRGEDGKYPDRASHHQEQSKFVDIYVPPHLYGQLAQHKPGLELLQEVGNIDGLIQTVLQSHCGTPDETRELKASLWALGHFAISVDGLHIIEQEGILDTIVTLAHSCPVLSVRHTSFHCLCLICCTQPGAESLQKHNWHAMPRNHHETYPIWGALSLRDKFPKPKLFPDLDQDLEMLDKQSINSKTDTCSNILLEEDGDSYLFLFEEQLMDSDSAVVDNQINHTVNHRHTISLDMDDSVLSEDLTDVDPVSVLTKSNIDPGQQPRKISYAHHRSQSDSQTLANSNSKLVNKSSNGGGGSSGSSSTVKNNNDQSGAENRDGSAPIATSTLKPGFLGGGSLRGRVSSFLSGNTGTGTSVGSGSVGSRLGTIGSGSWRWGKSRSGSVADAESSITSGVSSSCESSSMSKSLMGTNSEHVQTLSPIPSSASIATTTVMSNQPSVSNLSPPSRADVSRALTDPGTRFGSPSSYYRSVMRKPVIRMSVLSDMAIYPTPHRRTNSIREMKAGSLDRHSMLSPRDLFSETKLMRVNSSLTSLSTPSFRTRPEVETRGPCFMGLCLPKELNMIFLSGGNTPVPLGIESDSRASISDSGSSFSDDIQGLVCGSNPNVRSSGKEEPFEFHTVASCLGCVRLRELKPIHILTDEIADKSMENLTVSEGAEGNRYSLVSVGSVVSGSSLESNDKRRIIPDSPHGKNLLRKEIIRLVSNMMSCVGAKANEQGLLRLKQKFPRAFHDLCLYSELCALISSYNVRLPLRRFLQELFLDLPFEEFYAVADNILYPEVETPTSVCTTGSSTSATTTDTSESSTVIEVPIGLNVVIRENGNNNNVNNSEGDDTIIEAEDPDPTPCPSPTPSDELDSDYIDLK